MAGNRTSLLWIAPWIGIAAFAEVLSRNGVTPSESDPSGEMETVPFSWREHLIVVQASIEGLEDLEFAIDTGSSCSVLSNRIAERLGLKGESRDVSAWGVLVQVRQVLLPRLRIGRIEFSQVPMQVFDASHSPLGDLDGLLGLELLRRNLLTIDFVRHEVSFGGRFTCGRFSTFYPKAPFILVPMVIQARTMLFKLDTGAPTLVVYANRMPREIRTGRPAKAHARRQAGGWGRWRQVSIPEVAVGDSSWPQIEAFLVDGKEKPAPGLSGNLGVASLGFGRLQVDCLAGRFGWENR